MPFRVVPADKTHTEGKVFLLKGDKNMNLDTKQWHAFPGFVARLLQAGAFSTKKSTGLQSKLWGKSNKLEVHIIEVNEWRSMDEITKMHMLNTFLKAPPAKD